MGDDTSRLDISQTSVNVSEEIQLFQQGLISVNVDQNRRLSSFLGEDYRPVGIPHSSE